MVNIRLFVVHYTGAAIRLWDSRDAQTQQYTVALTF